MITSCSEILVIWYQWKFQEGKFSWTTYSCTSCNYLLHDIFTILNVRTNLVIISCSGNRFYNRNIQKKEPNQGKFHAVKWLEIWNQWKFQTVKISWTNDSILEWNSKVPSIFINVWHIGVAIISADCPFVTPESYEFYYLMSADVSNNEEVDLTGLPNFNSRKLLNNGTINELYVKICTYYSNCFKHIWILTFYKYLVQAKNLSI